MKLLKVTQAENIPRRLRSREEYVLKLGSKVVGYVSFFVHLDQLIIEHLAVDEKGKGYGMFILDELMKLGEKRKLDSIHFVKTIEGIDLSKFKRKTISIFSKKLTTEQQKNIKRLLEQFEAEEGLSEGLRKLPLK